ncbi:hypothetical protein AMTR_s00002p00237570 [Amborella trichopoda]|uniref:Uncharacterized protein n=1 Tax=Amborella trichopoda TaxID=13333 RepID=W1P2P7_AMBTC|nr:hypothetical protein AMTR_s00002p00237570 [Amborella trichopoda]
MERVRRAEQGRRPLEAVMAALFLVAVAAMLVEWKSDLPKVVLYILLAVLSHIVLAFLVWCRCVTRGSPRNVRESTVDISVQMVVRNRAEF